MSKHAGVADRPQEDERQGSVGKLLENGGATGVCHGLRNVQDLLLYHPQVDRLEDLGRAI